MAGNVSPRDAVKPYEYVVVPEPPYPIWSGVASLDPVHSGADDAPVHSHAESPARGEAQPGHSQREPAAESKHSFEAGLLQGIQEGRQFERESLATAYAAKENAWDNRIAALVQQFADARDRYLHAVEQEVVELALAIAARILRREAQMDPLLLTGAVRVALGQISASTDLKLHVPVADVALWQEAIGHVPGLAVPVCVLPEKDMRLGDCVVETGHGSVDLGVRAQLAEIERGFFDGARRQSAPLDEERAKSANLSGAEA